MIYFFLLLIILTPGIGIALYIYFLDHKEPEPIRMIIISFFLGILSFLLSLLFAILSSRILNINPDHHLTNNSSIQSFGLSGFLEEMCKFLLVMIFLYRNKNFNEPMDGIVYTVMVAMGFATAENFLYTYSNGGSAAIVRMFSAIPAHALFAIIMGYFLGKAKFLHRHEAWYAVAGLLVASIFHGFYDYFITLNSTPGIWFGSVIAFVLMLYLSGKALKLHQRSSPF